MFIILGVSLIVVTAVATTIASLIFANKTTSPALRAVTGSAIVGLLLSGLGGVGVAMVMLALEHPAVGAVGDIEDGVAAAIAVGGFVVIRLMRRWVRTPTEAA